ncbi:hypothetical protein FXO38_30032 [Capsicum annuum]|nr:hypothetical protein FXO38_30032 [Capsicum annuum]KAF3627495.1 hypothetical protein FXO37_29835 [Capsicum annuum]
MATTSGATNPSKESPKLNNRGESKVNSAAPKYADLLKNKTYVHETTRVPPKPIIIIPREPSVTWKSSKVKSLIIHENLQYEIIGKFSYGKPVITELRKSILSQCGIKGDCTKKVMDTRHILIILNQLEDYVQLLSTTAYSIKAKNMFW